MRDMRNQQVIGELILARNLGVSASEQADKIDAGVFGAIEASIPGYTLVQETSREYREKQISLAASGDLESTILCVEKGWGDKNTLDQYKSALDQSVRRALGVDEVGQGAHDPHVYGNLPNSGAE